MVLQRDVHGFAQRRDVTGLPARVSMIEAGAREPVDQLAERGDGVARQAPAVVVDVDQAVVDAHGELPMLGLVEAFGEASQALVGIGERGAIAVVPLAALQLLPDLEHLTCLVNDPLREVLLQFFLIRHVRFPGPLHSVFRG